MMSDDSEYIIFFQQIEIFFPDDSS